MVIPSRNAISSVDKSKEKDGVGLKKRRDIHFIFTFKDRIQNEEKKEH